MSDQFKLPDLGGLAQLPGLPDLNSPALEAPKFEDLSGQVPDICQAMKPAEQLQAERDGAVVLCPICHVPFCGSKEAQDAREAARLRSLRGF